MKSLIVSLSLLVCINAYGYFELSSSHIYAPAEIGEIQVRHTGNNFVVTSDDGDHEVQSHLTDKELRNISNDRLKKLLLAGAYVSVNRSNDGKNFILKLSQRLQGGGVAGATAGAFLGKALVSVIGHGTIALIAGGVGLFCPPAGVAVGIALESTCGAAIETASIAAAVACGVAGGVATGPV